MMRKLMMTTAIALVATSGAMAAEHKTKAADPAMEQAYLQNLGEAALATNMIGESVYASEDPDAEVIGDINNLVVADDGSIEAVVIGVGGFLGVGEKNVAVSFDSIRWVRTADEQEVAVYEATKESLQAAPEFVAEETAMAPADGAMEQSDQTAMAPAEEPMTEESMEQGDRTAMAPAEEPMTEESAEQESAMAPAEEPMAEGEDAAMTDQSTEPALSDVAAASVSAEQLIGATVYSSDDDNVGEVSDVRLTADGEVDAVVVDVGGFLGIGEKPVAIGFDSLSFRQDESGTIFVYTDFTREELEGAEDYDEAAYDSERDRMKLTRTQ